MWSLKRTRVERPKSPVRKAWLPVMVEFITCKSAIPIAGAFPDLESGAAKPIFRLRT